jgi:hypothetical protein
MNEANHEQGHDERRHQPTRNDIRSTVTPAKTNLVVPQTMHPAVLSPRTSSDVHRTAVTGGGHASASQVGEATPGGRGTRPAWRFHASNATPAPGGTSGGELLDRGELVLGISRRDDDEPAEGTVARVPSRVHCAAGNEHEPACGDAMFAVSEQECRLAVGNVERFVGVGMKVNRRPRVSGRYAPISAK